jgi:heme/copper-type cytochrome/quinol oxidase subunit 1
VRTRALNLAQRIVVIIGFGAGLFVVGSWLTTRGGRTGWVAYAPLSSALDGSGPPGPGLHAWVRLLIWLVLIVLWIVVGVVLLRSRATENASRTAD